MTSWRELYEDAADRLGAELIPLLVAPRHWMQRRVEQVTVASSSLVRRATSIDMVLPPAAARADLRLDATDPRSPMIFPLGFLRKAQLIDFDLRENGSPLLLVRAELNAIVAAALIAQEAKSDGCSDDDVRRAMPFFRRIAAADHADAAQAFEAAFHGDALGGAIADASGTREVALWLRDFYVLLIELPETGARRRLVSFATDQVVEPLGEEHSIRQRLGLDRTPLLLDAPGIDYAASYHVEIAVPRGCSIASAEVHGDGRPVAAPTQLIGRRAAIYPSEPASGDQRLALELRQERGYYFMPAAVLATLIALLLIAGATVAWFGTRPQATASALLLSGLSVVSGLIVRTDEDLLTTELHGLARIVLTVVMSAALVAGATIALGAHLAALARIWTAAAGFAAIGAATLWVGASRAAGEREIGSVTR